MKLKLRIASLAMILVMLCPLLGACKSDNTPQPSSSSQESSSSSQESSSQEPAEPAEPAMSLPFDETLTIKYWLPFDTKYAASYNSLNEVEIFNYIQELLNIKFDFIEPSGSTQAVQEQFGLMIASNDLPDVINSFDRFYGGKAKQGYEDGLIIDIRDYITDENMPNLTRLLAEFPELDKLSSFEGGRQLTVPYFRHTAGLYSTGWVLRQDILDANNLQHPETVEEFDALLYSFKSAGVKIPLMAGSLHTTIGISPLAPAWGMRGAYEYQIGDTHEVRFGATQPEFKELLDYYRKWYADGILDPDFMTNDSQTSNAKIAGGDVGAWFGSSTGDSLSPWNAALDADPNSTMVLYAIPDLKQTKGAQVTLEQAYGTANNFRAESANVISTKCADPAKVLFALDWLGYNNDGIALLHFGIEGQHWVREADGRINPYVDVNGASVYRMDADPSVTQWKKLANGKMTVWAGNSGGSFVNGIIDFENHMIVDPTSETAVVQPWFAEGDNSIETIKAKRDLVRINEWIPNWAIKSDHTYLLPGVKYTAEQTEVIANYYTAARTFIEEYCAGYILGTTNPDTFDQFVSDLYNKMELQKLIDAYQGAVNDYYAQ